MNHSQLMTALRERYQLDPQDGSRWVETDDLEQVASVACLSGKAFLPDAGIVTWAEGTGYQFAGDEPVDWAGRTFGQLTPDEKRRVTRAAGEQLSTELSASAGAIGAVLDQPLPPIPGHGSDHHSLSGPADCARCQLLRDNQSWMALPGEEPGKGDLVRFCQGDEARTMLVGRVTRPVWGTRARNVSIRTLDGQARLFVRLAENVEVIEVPEP